MVRIWGFEKPLKSSVVAAYKVRKQYNAPLGFNVFGVLGIFHPPGYFQTKCYQKRFAKIRIISARHPSVW